MIPASSWVLLLAIGAYLVAGIGQIGLFRGKNPSKWPRQAAYLGFSLHTAVLLLRTFLEGHPAVLSLFGWVLGMTWVGAAIVLILSLRPELRLTQPVLFPWFATLLIPVFLFDPKLAHAPPTLQGTWLWIHVGTVLLAYSLFLISFATALLYLIEDRALKKHSNFSIGGPGLAFLDLLSVSIATLGYFFLTLAMATGMVWAHYVWGSFWSWNAKETASLVVWVLYGLFFIHRSLGHFGKSSMWFLVFSFAVALFNLFGVDVGTGAHSYNF